jgi:phosphatidylglycerophosphate synthase
VTVARATVLALLPHALTVTRLAAAPLIFFAALAGEMVPAAVLVVLAMVTDAIDGPLVRRFGRPSEAGAMLDVWADFLTVFAAFAGLSAGGAIPLWPLLPIAASFALFLITARLGGVIYDPVGRYLGAVTMVAALLLLTVHDFLVQEIIFRAVTGLCAIGMAGRIVYLARRLLLGGVAGG